jgi:LysM repeat protein/ABC-type branched-subunit amino acid transport system substrate-binding protein
VHKTRSSATIGGIRYYLHTVEKGQTLFAIARVYGREVNDIVIENPEAIDGIRPGQILRIPVEKKKAEIAATDTTNFVIHKVEKGQTIYSITKQYGVSDEKLKLMNPELKDGLKVGMSLKIPSMKRVDKVSPQTPVVSPGTVAVNSQVLEAADRAGATTYLGEKKSEYNVAFFLPFHADESSQLDLEKLIKGDVEFSQKTTVALQFYEGALLALDSLRKTKLNVKAFVYDVDDKDSAGISNILKKPELKEMDLIIGPLYGSSFMPVAKFAKEQQIAIVSPFTQVNKILFENPYVCKLSPSITLQVEQMANFVADSMSTHNIILVNTQNVKDAAFFNAFKTAANAALIAKGRAPADSVRIATGLASTQSFLNSGKTNVVVLLSNNQSYVSDFISKLNMSSEKNKIVLFGLQSWMNYDNLDFEYLNRLSLHVPSNYHLDYGAVPTQKFISNYRERFRTEPELYAFQGFDATLFFLSEMQKNGSGFLGTLMTSKFAGLQSQYLFSQFPAGSGFENKFVYILKYQDYKITRAN